MNREIWQGFIGFFALPLFDSLNLKAKLAPSGQQNAAVRSSVIEK